VFLTWETHLIWDISIRTKLRKKLKKQSASKISNIGRARKDPTFQGKTTIGGKAAHPNAWIVDGSWPTESLPDAGSVLASMFEEKNTTTGRVA